MKSSLVKGAFYLTVASIVFMLSGYGVNIWLGRHLGPEAYGLYGIIISLVTLINLAQTSGLPLAVSKYIAADVNHSDAIYRTGFYIQITSTSLVSLMFFLVSGTIASVLKESTITPYLKFASFVFPFYSMYALMGGYYNGRHFFKRQAVINILYSLSKIILIIFLVILFRLYGVIAGFIISPIFALLGGFVLPKKTLYHFPYKTLILFSLPLIGFAIFSNLLQTIDLFFLKSLLDSNKVAGLYTASQNISRIPFFALSALSGVLFPSISKKLSAELHEEASAMIYQSLRIVLLVLTPTVTLMSVTSKDLITFIYSDKYVNGSVPLAVLTIGIGFLVIFTILCNIMSGAGKPKIALTISAFGVLVTSLSCLVLIPRFGMTGAALSTTIGGIVAFVIALTFIHQIFKNSLPVKSALKILTAAFFTYFVANFLVISSLLLIIKYMILFIFYMILLILMKEVSRGDIRIIWELIRRKKE